ncbi:cupin domain-containing protein [Azospirillum formosense]|uniref:cupin domain-containing protein n=1 Tax=Azospirillum formosense TaxID=861533 RepID=UPI001FFF5B59|nr:cupin domain-containing protein [Azospirillum formosense]
MGKIAVMGRPQVWDYWRPIGSGIGIVELGTVRGRDVALPVHFHREDQVTFVLAGRRRFVIAGDLCEAGPGEGVHIPAGLPHRSLSGPDEVVCVNLYTPPGLHAAPEVIAGLARHWRRTGGV